MHTFACMRVRVCMGRCAVVRVFTCTLYYKQKNRESCCVDICIHTCTRMRIYSHAHVHTNTHTHKVSFSHALTHTHVNTLMHKIMYLYICTSMCLTLSVHPSPSLASSDSRPLTCACSLSLFVSLLLSLSLLLPLSVSLPLSPSLYFSLVWAKQAFMLPGANLPMPARAPIARCSLGILKHL